MRSLNASCQSFLVTLLLALCLLTVSSAVSAGEAQPPGAAVARVYYTDRADLDRLAAGLDIWEVNRAAGYVVVLLTPARYAALTTAGYRIEIDQARTEALSAPRAASPDQTGIPGYPCYRTVEETYASMAALAAAYPNLAAWTDIGDSWDKVMPDGPAGYDLYELTLTNAEIPGPKPRFLLIAAVHAREYATAELAARFVEKLAADYGVDPDTTWLLDHYELRAVFQANPDGRKKAEAGTLWRKNTDNDDGCTTTYGVDLNRNSTFKWGTAGSSTNPCDDTYRGPAAGSEPEVQTLEGHMRALFADQRGPGEDDPAPADTEGLMITLHSYGQLVLFPWGWTPTQQAPNHTQLQTLGRKFGFYNGYQVCAAGPCLYTVSGSTDDFAYGELGIAAYTFEMGTEFFQSCTVFENNILPRNLPALKYAFKAARRPYQKPAGPEVVSVAVGPSVVVRGARVTLTARADDGRSSSNGYGSEPAQNVIAARYTVDVPSWKGGISYPMAAADGAFNAPAENLTASLDTTAWAPGRHIVFVEAQDATGQWGVPTAVFLEVRPLHHIFLPLIITAEPASPPTLVRGPYVQQVSASSALLVWATDQPGASEVCFGETSLCEPRLPAVSTRVGAEYHHVARLTGLLPQRLYYYKAWTAGVAVAPTATWRPITGTPGVNFTFAVLGDSRGATAGSTQVRAQLAGQMAGAGVDLILHTGDLTSIGTAADYDAEVFAAFRTLLARVALYPALGAHDRETDPPQPFTDLFYVPQNGPRGLLGRAYAFDQGNAHFVVLDSTANYLPGSPQYAWLVEELTRTEQLWKIVVLHHPPYSSSPTGSDITARANLAPVFEKLGVDLVFAGRDHRYERTHPLIGGQPAPAGVRGVVYVVTGGGGEPLDSGGEEAFTAVARATHHFVRAQVRGCTMAIQAIGLDGLPFDSFILDKCSFTWSRVNDAGFGEHPGVPYTGQDIFDLAVYRDQLYVGMEGRACARIWRTRAGVTAPSSQADWEQVVADGFDGGQDCNIYPPTTDNDHIDSLEPFNGYLYASTAMQTGNKRGSQVWRSATGDPGDWQQVNRPGFGIHTNENFKDMVAFQGLLCGGTYSAGELLDPNNPLGAYIIPPGAQVWCTDGVTPDPADPGRLLWTQHNKNGFGNPDNVRVWSSATFAGALYMGVGGGSPAPSATGTSRAGSVWRTTDIRNPGAWEQVFTPADAGLGDEVTYIGVLDAFDGYLYIGFERPGHGTQVWRSATGARGAWQAVVTDGFGNTTSGTFPSNGATVFDGALYLAPIDRTYGVGIWRTTDGRRWEQVNGSGFGHPGGFAADLTSFNGALYAWAVNYEWGQGVWRGVPPAPGNAR